MNRLFPAFLLSLPLLFSRTAAAEEPVPVAPSSDSETPAAQPLENAPVPPLAPTQPPGIAPVPPPTPTPAPAAQTTGTPGSQGPQIVLPPNEPAPPKSDGVAHLAPRAADPTLASDRSYATDLGNGRRIPIGAYGEATLLNYKDETQLRLKRLVLFLGHRFADWAAVYSELEVEDVKEIELEQSYLDLTPFKTPRIGLRVGLLLVPLGIVNLYHEPPTFNGVDRPVVDQLIIPTTWRELGIGLFGTIFPGLHYQVYAVAGIDGSKIRADEGLEPALSQGVEVSVSNAAVTGRVNYNRILGLDVAAGFYYGTANNKDQGLNGVKVGIFETDARFSRFGLSLRAEYVRVLISGADKITQLIRASDPTATAIGSAEQGFYGEVGYDLLHSLQGTRQQLVVFGRYELADTRAKLTQIADPGTSTALQFVTAGITYRPLPELALKFDYRRTLDGSALIEDSARPIGRDRYSFGIAFMY
jgi:hypothetical protein